MNNQRVVIIGSGIGGLGVACLLGKAGYHVQVFEKNDKLGGRINVFQEQGYTFDMGPSWYLMPDVFQNFFALTGNRVEDHLDLVRLDPSYRIFFKDKNKVVDIFSDLERDAKTFEALEPGSSEKLREYLRRAESQYKTAIELFMYRNYDSIFDFFNLKTLIEGSRLSVFKSMHSYVKKFFKSDELQKILQYTLVFLGGSPYNTPAMYNIMSHVDFNMGVFYPKGGLYRITETLHNIGKQAGVSYQVNAGVKRILLKEGRATGVELMDGTVVEADIVISNADIHHTETKLLPREAQSYPESFWNKKTLAPSAFIMYLGINGKVPSLTHHNLLFSQDWSKSFGEIFDHPEWPTDPSIYVCAPSVTDATVAPAGKENLFVLVPMASGLTYTQAELEAYGEKILDTLEKDLDVKDIRQRIEVKRYFCSDDFTSLYNSYKGTALGLAHTLTQTAWFRPDTRSKKVSNLYYVGANTNPGIGMPTCLISAELAYKRITGNTSPSHLTSL